MKRKVIGALIKQAVLFRQKNEAESRLCLYSFERFTLTSFRMTITQALSVAQLCLFTCQDPAASKFYYSNGKHRIPLTNIRRLSYTQSEAYSLYWFALNVIFFKLPACHRLRNHYYKGQMYIVCMLNKNLSIFSR